ncbi:MAG: tetratricopeptide repeat protein, partial [Sphingopyxis granuli]
MRGGRIGGRSRPPEHDMPLAQPQAGLEQALGQAMALARSGRFDAAEAGLQAILAQSPDQPDALQLLGMVARRRGDHTAATALFRRSLAVRPAQPHVLNNLGSSLSDLGRHAEAAAAYQEALALAPSYDDARINLALARIALGDPGAARDGLAPL